MPAIPFKGKKDPVFWEVSTWSNGRIAIQASRNDEFDEALEITGNFKDDAQKRLRAEELCELLNGPWKSVHGRKVR